MKKLLKKTLAIALAATLVLGAGPIAGLCGLELPSIGSFVASAAEEEPVWTVATDDMLRIEGNTIIGYTDKLAGNIEIPAKTSNGTAITTIDSSAFKGCSDLTALKIPENITKIGYYPFQNCSKLETICFNATNCIVNKSTDNYNGCTSFTKIIFGENVTAIPDNACIGASALQTVVFKGTVTKIGADAFNGCSSLTGVDLSNVTEIGNNAFANCISVPSFTFSENLKTIGSSAFIGCNMTEITIPENVTKIGYYPFQNCSKLETICFNATNCIVNKSTDNYNGCTSFTKIIFGENVTAIPDNACIGASALQTVVFKGTVTKIGADAFNGCSSLTGVDLSNVTEIGNNAFANCISVPSFTFSENLKTIGSSAFIGCNMTEITIPENVTKIGYYPFQNCTKLQTVYFNAANCAVNSSTNNHSGCTAFTKIVFGENVTAIPAYACYYAKALQKVEILGEFTSIGSDAFKGCTALNEIYLDAYSEDSFDFNALKIGSGNDVVTEDIFTFGLYNVTYPNTSSDIDVTVSCNSKTFEAEVKLSVTETEGEREKGSIAISDKEISEQIGCFNIKMILADGSSTSAVQPNGKVTVKMAIPASYIGKTNFKIVHRTGNGQRENFATNPKGNEKKLSVSSDGKYWIFEVTSFSDFEFFAVEAAPAVSIKNNTGSKTISYGETLRLTANTSNMPADAKIFWYVDNVKKGEGTTFEVSPESGSVEVTVKVVDANGNDYADTDISDTEKVTVKSGFFQKLISFFKNLFRISRVVTQALMVK